MKTQFANSSCKFTFISLLLVFAFSLQSFKSVSGIQIEKRHYRKGYYVHICHGEKTYPVSTSAVAVKQEKPERVEEQKNIQQNSSEIPDSKTSQPSRTLNITPERSINRAPVSQAPVPSN